ncbi:class I SAM-dependent methyltransferase [Clostridium sp. UBA4395]|uniref:class I SAM-dependent methyltransferase n=1 Tax=Clostridium sp. UBA4395 TaxID=1946360 RepID=UPI003217846D
MEYMGNKEYWDDKFENRSDKPLSAEKSIIENMGYFKKGSVLDIACGDGRNTLFFLGEGFQVTGIDFSNKALERLNRFAKRNNYLVHTKQIDLSVINSLKNIGTFDNVLVNHYRLSKNQLEYVGECIADAGILFVCGFGWKHKVDTKIRKDDLIQQTDFKDLNKSFKLIKYSESQDDRGFIVTYIFKKIKS